MSEIALVAEMRPKSYGSSTIGRKKSVVATIACSALMRYTAASSLDSVPTSRFESTLPSGDSASNSPSSAAGSLQPHPPPWENCVRRIVFDSTGLFIARLDQMLPSVKNFQCRLTCFPKTCNSACVDQYDQNTPSIRRRTAGLHAG